MSEEERKAELRKKIEYQVACEERAFRIVERLIENPVTEQAFLDALQFITPNHYSDIVEERAVSKLCGYPVCDKPLSNTPKQRYRISTKTNKVYDIEERKNFCSGKCYKASLYLQKQISTAPLWTRKKQPPVKFELLPRDGKSGYVGDEVVMSQREELKQDLKKLERLDRYQEALKKKQLEETSSEFSKEKTKADDDRIPGSTKDRPDSDSSMHDIDGADNEKCVYTLERALEEMKIDSENVDADKSGSENSNLEDESETNGPMRPFSDGSHKTDVVSRGIEHVTGSAVKSEERLPKKTETVKQIDNSKTKHEGSKMGPDPGESKTDYLMRLLDKRKSMLAKMADIQPLSCADQEMAQGACNSKVLNNDTTSKTVLPEQSSDRVSGEDNYKVLEKDNDSEIKVIERTTKGKCDIANEPLGAVKTNLHPQHKPQKAISNESAVVSKGTALVKEIGSPSKMTENEKRTVSTLQLISITIQAWITVESLEYLNKKDSEEPDSQKSEFERHYKALERKIDKQERDFENMFGEEMVEDDEASIPSRPLPHFEVLKKEIEEDTIRVQEFMKGSYTYKVEERETGKVGDKSQEIVLPSVDRYDQMLIRQRIVLERISKVLPDLLKPLHLLIQHVFTELRELVFTFNLTKDNILFKPAEWILVTLVLLKLISSINTMVRSGFDTSEGKKYFSIVLRGAGSNLDELENCIFELKRTGTKP